MASAVVPSISVTQLIPIPCIVLSKLVSKYKTIPVLSGNADDYWAQAMWRHWTRCDCASGISSVLDPSAERRASADCGVRTVVEDEWSRSSRLQLSSSTAIESLIKFQRSSSFVCTGVRRRACVRAYVIIVFPSTGATGRKKKNGVRVSSDCAQLAVVANEMIFRVPPPPVVVIVCSFA